jgi:hypothetical protein
MNEPSHPDQDLYCSLITFVKIIAILALHSNYLEFPLRSKGVSIVSHKNGFSSKPKKL